MSLSNSLLVLILGTGLFLQIGLKIMPIRKLGYGFRLLWKGRVAPSGSKGEISPFNALMTSLAATDRVGIRRELVRQLERALEEQKQAGGRVGEHLVRLGFVLAALFMGGMGLVYLVFGRELAALFLRLFRSLDALVGGDETRSRAWMHAHNHHLNGTPAELVRSVSGLVHVVEYLDAMRGKS